MSDTKSSMSAVQPDAKPTVEMVPPPAYAIRLGELLSKLGESVTLGFERVNSDIAVVKNRQEVQAAQMKDLGKELGSLGERVDRLEGRTDTNSVRVRSTTDENLKQDSAIATLVADVAGLKTSQAAQTKHLETLVDGGKALMKNPKFLLLLAALYAYAMSWLGKHGGVP